MKQFSAAIVICCITLTVATNAFGQLSTSSPAPTASPTLSASVTPLPSIMPLPSLTPTPSVTPTPSATPQPSQSPAQVNPVLGKCVDGNSGLAIEFEANGAMVASLPDGSASEGTYLFTDNTHIQVQPGSELIPSGAYIATVVLNLAHCILDNSTQSNFLYDALDRCTSISHALETTDGVPIYQGSPVDGRDFAR